MEDLLIGTTDRTILVWIPDPTATTGTGKTGLAHSAVTVSYTRVETDNDVVVTDVTSSMNALTNLTDAHTDWGWKEVSSTLAPGLYRLDVADAVFATGAWYGVVQVSITSGLTAATPKAFRLVARNDLDGVRLGLTALPNAAADAAGGLPISDAGGLDLDAQRADVAAVLVDTGTTLDGRLPAALVGGRMDSSVGAYQTGLTPLQPTTAGRTLDVTATGAAGIDWANVENPTTTVGLSGTTVKAVTDNVNAVLADAAHGGSSATLTFSRLIGSSATTNQPCVSLTGNGTAPGLKSTGGSGNAEGVYLLGGGTTGIALRLGSAGVASHSLYCDAQILVNDEVTIGNLTTGNVLGGTVTYSSLSANGSGLTGVGVGATSVRAAVGLAAANLDTQLADLPTVAEFEARTLSAASYATAAALDAVDNFVDTEVAAILAAIGTPSDLGSGATLAANLVDVESQTDDIGVAGAGLTALPWNAAWDAEVQSEVQDAIEANNLDHLLKSAVDTDFATTVQANSVVGHLADNGAGFDRTTDSLEAVRDRGDAAWATATGFSTHTAADVWAAATRTLTALDEDATTLDLDATIRAALGLAAADIDAQLAALPTAAENATAALTTQMTESYAANGTAPTMAQAAFAIHQMLMAFAISGTSYTVKKLDGSTTAFVVTLNDATDPTGAARS